MKCSRSLRAVTLVLALTLSAPVFAQAAGPTAAERVDDLIGVLKSSSSSEQQKHLACQQLQVIGDARAIPVLASMLRDERLGHRARQALEANPDPAVDAAFRQALRTVKGNLLVGVIDSVGNRRDAKATDALVRHLRGEDVRVASAAARALGRIATEKSILALEQTAAGAPSAVKPAILEGYLIAADTAYASGGREQAARMFDWLLQQETPKPVRVAAVRGAIVSRGHPDGTALAVEQLKSDDEEMFAVALRVLQESEGSELAAACAARLGELPAARQVRLIDALAGRGGNEAVGALVAATEMGAANVRVAAIRALAQLGDAAGLPVLLKALADSDADVANAAQAGLAAFPGSEADAAVLAMLANEDPAQRRAAIEIIAKRQVPDVTNTLVKAAGDGDGQTRLAAIRALGAIAPAGEIAAVVRVLVSAKPGQDAQAAEAAVAAVIARAEPREAMAEPLIAAMADAGAVERCALLRLLPAAGGAQALEAVRGGTRMLDKQVQDAAIRALCNWPTADAAADVLAIARDGDSRVHKQLALRGYIRMTADAALSPEQRGAMCAEAVKLARTPDDKKLVLGALGAVPTKESLAAVMAQMEDSAVSEEAVAAALAIAEKLAASEREAVKSALTKAAGTAKNEELLRRVHALLGQADRNTP